MLQFPQGFFENEYREGFLVDSTMKSFWAAELEVLAEVAAVCEKYQLPWYAYWGTLLGAVRHNGYVPWDDDIDICMKREDFQKLMQVLQQELPEGWKVYHAGSGNPQDVFWVSVMNSEYVSISPDHLKRFHGCPFVAGIDIFQLDYIPRDAKEDEMEKTLFGLIIDTLKLAGQENKSMNDKKQLNDILRELEGFFHTRIKRDETLTTQLWQLADRLCMSYGKAEGDYLAGYTTYFWGNKKFEECWFDDVEYLPFESVYMPVPIGYDEILKTLYGDYMVCKRDTQTHDYPLYKDQIEQVRRHLQELEAKAAGEGGGQIN